MSPTQYLLGCEQVNNNAMMEVEQQEYEAKCLSKLKGLIKESGDEYLNSLVDEDDYLQTFLIGRKFDVQRAFETAKGHLQARNGKFRDVFAMSPESVKHILDSGFFGSLRNRDDKGRLIAFMRIPKLDIKSMEFDEIMRTATMFVESYWYDRSAIESGQVFIVDYSGYNWSIFTKYTFNQKVNFATLFLNNYPTKFKEAHIYNNPKIVSYTYSILKPFLPEKLRKRIFLHGSNKSALLEHFSPSILPKFMGGLLPDEEAIDFNLIERFLNKTFPPNNKIIP